MGKEKESPEGERRLVVRPRLFRELKALAHERDTNSTTEMNRAVREMLEREGRWPPKESDVAGAD